MTLETDIERISIRNESDKQLKKILKIAYNWFWERKNTAEQYWKESKIYYNEIKEVIRNVSIKPESES